METNRPTVYRDAGTLTAQRVPARGDAGIGYVVERGFGMPRLMLSSDGIEAMVLGGQWVLSHADPVLARAAASVLANIAVVLPEDLQAVIDDPLMIMPPDVHESNGATIDVASLEPAWSQVLDTLRL